MKKERFFSFFSFFILISSGVLIVDAKAKNASASNDFCSLPFERRANGRHAEANNSDIAKTPTDGGIREEVSRKYRARYEKWKNEFLATEFGRREWNDYAANKNFVLVIKISGDEGQGAGTSDYKWDEAGNLIGATIILGSKIDKGYPNPIYFPVVNSLSVKKPTYRISENILAAAKFAHEFGHVKQTAKTGGEVFRRQNDLIGEYNEIFRESGFDLGDTRLTALQENLGGTPVKIWENREYWGETNAMNFLVERIGKEEFYCSVIDKIETNVKSFAAGYEDRFMQIIESSDACRN